MKKTENYLDEAIENILPRQSVLISGGDNPIQPQAPAVRVSIVSPGSSVSNLNQIVGKQTNPSKEQNLNSNFLYLVSLKDYYHAVYLHLI